MTTLVINESAPLTLVIEDEDVILNVESVEQSIVVTDGGLAGPGAAQELYAAGMIGAPTVEAMAAFLEAQAAQGVQAAVDAAVAGLIKTYIQPTAPSDSAAHLWVQTGLGASGNDFTIWIEDGA